LRAYGASRHHSVGRPRRGDGPHDLQVVDVAAEALRREPEVGVVRPQCLQDVLPDDVVRADAGEQRRRAVVAAVRRLAQRQVHRCGAEDGGGGAVLGAAQRHVVDLRREALVGLARQREAGRVPARWR
jgi:hypothetical protein